MGNVNNQKKTTRNLTPKGFDNGGGGFYLALPTDINNWIYPNSSGYTLKINNNDFKIGDSLNGFCGSGAGTIDQALIILSDNASINGKNNSTQFQYLAQYANFNLYKLSESDWILTVSPAMSVKV